MCKDCGCSAAGGNTRLQFSVSGYNEDNAKELERRLLGLAGVMYVHIHTHDGETTIDYSSSKTKLTEILAVFEEFELKANI